MRLTVDSELSEVQEHLNALYRALNGDLTRPMTRVAGSLRKSTVKRFSSKAAPDGSLWAGLKPATLRAKAKKDGGERGLRSSGGGGLRIAVWQGDDRADGTQGVHAEG